MSGRTKGLRRVAPVSLVVLAMLQVAPAHAQTGAVTTAGDAAIQPEGAASGSGVAEIIVTAERRASSVQRTSVPIDVLSSDAVKAAGVTQPMDLTRLSAGIQIGATGPAAQIYIRGVGDFGSTAVSNPAVAFNVDGVYVARTQSLAGMFYDLQRVEVLKGPQGTLYGRNASGGAVNVITNRPKLGDTSATLGLEIANYDQIKTEGALNLPVGDDLAIRGAFQIVHRDGFTNNGFDDDKHESGRLQALWDPGNGVSLLLAGDYTHVGGKGSAYVLFPKLSGRSAWTDVTSPEVGALMTAASPFPGAIAGPSASVAGQNLQFWNVRAELNADLGFATLTFLPAYRSARMRYVAFPTFEYRVGTKADPFDAAPETSKTATAELRLAHDTQALKWVAGVYFYDERQRSDSLVNMGALQHEFASARLRTRSYAAFGQTTVSITDRLRLIGGGRYTKDERKMPNLVKIAVFPAVGCFDPSIPTCFREQLSGSRTFDNFSWKGGLEFDVAPRSMFYATASRGFKAGGFSLLGAAAAGSSEPSSYDPEILTAYEVGIKNRFLDNRLQLNLEGFYWDYKDHQEQFITLDGNGAVGQAFVNAGKARQFGFNVDMIATPTPNDTLHIGVEYLNSKYTEFSYEVAASYIAPGSTACRLTPTGKVGASGPIDRLDCSGFQLTRAPKWTGAASYSHRFELADGNTIEPSVDMTFASARWLAPEFIANERAPSYASFNASLRFVDQDNNLSITAFVRNISKEEIYTGGIENPFAPGVVGANIGAPRTFGVRAEMNF